VYDTTVLRPFGARDSSAITQRDPRSEEPGTDVAGDADDLLAAILTTNSTLAARRTLSAGVSPRSLSEEDLISFWADDRMASASGTVSGTGQP
jgi:hypothetical protein